MDLFRSLLVIVLFSFASSDQLRSSAVPTFFIGDRFVIPCTTLFGWRPVVLVVGGELRQQNSIAFGRHTDIAIKLQTDSYRCQAVELMRSLHRLATVATALKT